MNNTIRKAIEPDFEAIFDLNALAFGQEDEAQLVESIRLTPEYLPKLELVAVQNQKIIGHILYSRVLIGKTDCDAVALAPMSVLPSFQKQGLGSRLIRHSLVEVEKSGFKSVIVLGHPQYYPRFGFKPASLWGIKFPQDVPDNVFMALSFTPDALSTCSGVISYSSAFGL